MEEPLLMKVVILDLRMCMKEDNPSKKKNQMYFLFGAYQKTNVLSIYFWVCVASTFYSN